MIKHVPALGWNTWNTFTGEINEELILQSAEIMAKNGLKEAGYQYIVIDDCWSLDERDENGKLVPDPIKFPHGMKYIADKIHALGLKFGMYACVGTLTCASYPGSYDHEYVDAQTFAEWEVDYLKCDYCFHSQCVPAYSVYKRMALALANCGRDILFSACSWGADNTPIWIKETGANSWRSTYDIIDKWDSIKKIATQQLRVLEYNGQGCFNDLDMLVCGMNGKGTIGSPEDGKQGCSENEYFLHFAFWCFMQSPIMIGCDIRNIDNTTLKYLTNRDLLRINQDEKYNQPFLLNLDGPLLPNKHLSNENPYFYEKYCLDTPVLGKILDDGDIAIGWFNFSDTKANQFSNCFNLETLGIPESSKKTLLMRNVVTNEALVVKNGHIGLSVEPHSCTVFICKVIDK